MRQVRRIAVVFTAFFSILGCGGGSSSGTARTIAITAPSSGSQVTGSRTVTVSGTMTGEGTLAVGLQVNGGTSTAATVTGGTFAGSVDLVDGANTITATVTDSGGTKSTTVDVTYVPAPTITITAPTASQQITGSRTITVSGAVAGAGTLTVALQVNAGSAVAATVSGGTYSGSVTLADGANTITATVTGTGGTGTATVAVTYVPAATITITAPTAGQQFIGSRTVTVTGAVAGVGTLTVGLQVNGGTAVAATVSGGTYSGSVTLVDGANTITATVTGTGGDGIATVAVTYVPAPTITITAPTASQQFTGSRTVTVSGAVAGAGTLTVGLQVNGGTSSAATVTGGTYSGSVTLVDGANTITATVTGTGGTGTATVAVTYVPAPTITITAPTASQQFTGSRTVTVSGAVAGAGTLTVGLQVNGGTSSAATVSSGTYSGSVTLVDGANTITATVTGTGGDGIATVAVTYVPAPTITITAPTASQQFTGSRTVTVSGAVAGAGTLTVGLQVNGGTSSAATVTGGTYSGNVTLVDGANTITATVTGTGGTGTATVAVTYVPAPTITITAPLNNARVTGTHTVTVTGAVAGVGTLTVGLQVNGGTSTAATVSSGTYSGSVTLVDGANTITATVTGTGGSTPASVSVFVPHLPLTNFQNATLVLGQADYVSNAPNRGGAAGLNTLSSPYGSATWDGARLYVPDFGNRRVLGFAGFPATNGAAASFTLGDGAGPSATEWGSTVDLLANGNRLFVADYEFHRVLIVSPAPTADGAAATVAVGQASLTASVVACTASSLNGPQSMFVVGGKLIVADTLNNRVLIWNTVPATSGTAADVVLGQADFTTCTANTGGASGQTLNEPTGIWSDGTRLYVADGSNNRILGWNTIPTSSGAAANFVLGQPDLVTITPAVGADGLFGPYHLASNGNQLFVADAGNNRVLIWNTIPTTTAQAANAVLGQNDFTHNQANDDAQAGTPGAAPTARTLSHPDGITVYDGGLIVSDTSNQRILVYR